MVLVIWLSEVIVLRVMDLDRHLTVVAEKLQGRLDKVGEFHQSFTLCDLVWIMRSHS
jgi:hypothetical protein